MHRRSRTLGSKPAPVLGQLRDLLAGRPQPGKEALVSLGTSFAFANQRTVLARGLLVDERFPGNQSPAGGRRGRAHRRGRSGPPAYCRAIVADQRSPRPDLLSRPDAPLRAAFSGLAMRGLRGAAARGGYTTGTTAPTCSSSALSRKFSVLRWRIPRVGAGFWCWGWFGFGYLLSLMLSSASALAWASLAFVRRGMVWGVSPMRSWLRQMVPSSAIRSGRL